MKPIYRIKQEQLWINARQRDQENNASGWLAMEPILNIHYDLVEEGREPYDPHLQIFIAREMIEFRRVA